MLIPTVIGRILALLTILIVIFVRVEAYHANNLNASWYFSTVTRKISSGNSGAGAFLFQACFSSQSRTNCLSKLDGFCPALYWSAGQKLANQLISKKRYIVEQCFGTIKRLFRMGRASYFGTVKVNAQVIPVSYTHLTLPTNREV